MACTEINFCVDSGGNLYDGQYTTDSGLYNGFTSYTGDSVPFFIYYSLTQDRWCLSTSLGGSCSQFGPVGIGSDCPDFDESFFITGVCITTTTTTSPCDIFNFEAIFDCLVPTTTTTTTIAPTTTTTTTVPFDPCTGVSVNASITAYTTTTTTIPVTTTTTTEVIRPCNFDGVVTFNTFDEYMKCGNSKKFRDCLTGIEYFSNDLLFNESGDTLIQNWVYKSTINGVSTCVTFMGLVDNISGSDVITINETLGSELQGACLDCVPDPSFIMCFNLQTEIYSSWQCTLSNLGYYNGKPYYLLLQPDCTTPSTISGGNKEFVVWNSTLSRWEVVLATSISTINSGTVILYNNNQSNYPETNNTYSWIDNGYNLMVIYFSLQGNCPTPTPTTTTTTTVGCQIVQYIVQNNGITVQEFKYFDCDGNTINCVIGIGINSTRTICSSSIPIVLPNSNVLVYPVTPQTFCNSATIC